MPDPVDFNSSMLPIGMVMFAITVGGALRKRAGHIVARAHYPKLAEELGLSLTASRYASGVGKLTGTFQGFSVTVDPDDQRQIRVSFSRPVGVELWMHEHNKRPPPGMRTFRPKSSALASLFRTAHGEEEAISKLEAAPDLDELAKLRRLRPLKSLSVTDRGVTAVLDYGSPPFIPADVVRSLLPRLVQLARVFDEPMDSPES